MADETKADETKALRWPPDVARVLVDLIMDSANRVIEKKSAAWWQTLTKRQQRRALAEAGANATVRDAWLLHHKATGNES